MIVTYNLKPFLKIDLGSFSKSYLKFILWVVKLLKLNIEKSSFDYQDTKCCNLAILNVLPKLLPSPNLHFRFMQNSVHMSLLWSLIKIIAYQLHVQAGLSLISLFINKRLLKIFLHLLRWNRDWSKYGAENK